MPKTLSPPQIQAFRRRISEVATRLFAERGYDGVTLRAIADEVGCSRMTPYRYFRDKNEILAAVRAEAFNRFTARMQAAYESSHDAASRLRALGNAYFDFAEEEPYAYKIMFDYLQVGESDELDHFGSEARKILFRAYRDACHQGVLRGDPHVLSHLGWATLHGAIVLAANGQLQFGPDVHDLRRAILDAFVAPNAQYAVPETSANHPSDNGATHP